jgi:hydrogenase expression/formation protein HypE
MAEDKTPRLTCPIPISDYPVVLLAHGGGGTLTGQLIDKLFVTAFDSPELKAKTDAAMLTVDNGRLAFTTDSFVVSPLFFPGGDIGSLAVHGTVNDLATSGARPLYLSAGFIIEEGLPMATLWEIVVSMADAARRAGVAVVTGDTKVVERGKGDGVYINTSGVGIIEHGLNIGPTSIRPGDAIIVNGDIGRHGMAIMAARESLGFKSRIESDAASLSSLVQSLIEAGLEIHCLRDLTRGGLASAANELAAAADVTFEIEESRVPVDEAVTGFCEVLGIDVYHSACEGRMMIILPEKETERCLELLKKHPLGGGSAMIGRVTDIKSAPVVLISAVGTRRVLPMLSGEQLPRIC